VLLKEVLKLAKIGKLVKFGKQTKVWSHVFMAHSVVACFISTFQYTQSTFQFHL